jgi:hypothetical protein
MPARPRSSRARSEAFPSRLFSQAAHARSAGHARESETGNPSSPSERGRPVYPSETIFRNSCVKGFARMGTSIGPAAFIAGVVMWASIAA